MKYTILCIICLLVSSQLLAQVELEIVIDHLINDDASRTIENLSKLSKKKSKNGTFQFKKIGLTINDLSNNGKCNAIILPNENLFINGKQISGLLDIHEVEKALGFSTSYTLLNDVAISGKNLVKLTKIYEKGRVDLYFSIIKPVLNSDILLIVEGIVDLKNISKKQELFLEKIETSRIPIKSVNQLCNISIGQYPEYLYEGETDEETLQNIDYLLKKHSIDERNQLLNSTSNFFSKKGDFIKAAIYMQKLVDSTKGNYLGGVLELMELYLITKNYDKVQSLHLKYGKSFLPNGYRFLSYAYWHFANVISNGIVANEVNYLHEALKFLDFEQLNWNFEMLNKNNLHGININQIEHIMTIIREIESANFQKRMQGVREASLVPSPLFLYKKQKQDKESENNIIFRAIEVEPKFKIGGIPGMNRYIDQNLKYPESAIKAKVSGKVHVKIIIERDGSIGETNILKGIGNGCDEEALRLVKSFPPFIPGFQDGKAMRVYYTIAIPFNLPD